MHTEIMYLNSRREETEIGNRDLKAAGSNRCSQRNMGLRRRGRQETCDLPRMD